MSIVEQIAEVREQRRRAAETRADELARKDAAGKKVDPVEALDTITVAALPDDWFPKRVAHYRTRAAQLATIARQPELDQARAEAQAELDAAAAEFKVAQEKYAARYNPAQVALEAANRQLSDCGTARAQLRRTCLDPAIIGRVREIGNATLQAQEQTKALTERQRYVAGEIARLEPQLADSIVRRDRPRPSNYPDPRTSYTPGDFDAKEHDRLQNLVSHLQAESTKNEAALLALPATVASLQAEQAELLVKAEASPL